MAGAFTAVPGGAEAVCSNPASLLELSSPELTAVYGRLYSGLSDDSNIGQGYFGIAAPVHSYLRGVAGFAWNDTRLSEAFSETSYSLSYATAVYRGIGAGLTLKYLHRSYVSDDYTALDPVFAGGYSKGAFGADLGFFYRPRARYAFGLAFKNINKPDLGLASEDRLPVEVRAGASYLVKTSLLDVDAAFAGPDYTISAGAEYSFQKRYFLRMGLAAGNEARRSVNVGLGGRFGLAAFDYAFSLPIGGIAGTNGSHRLAFSFRFGTEAELQQAAELAAGAELSRIQERAALQGEKIRVLQERLDALVLQGIAPAPQPAQVQPVSQAQPPAGQDELMRQIEAIKQELERSRAETEAIKARVEAKPAAVTPQPAPKVQPEPSGQTELTRQIEALKLELEKSRIEMELIKTRAEIKPAAVTPQPKAQQPKAKPQPQQPVSRHSYVVKAGDTLESIAASVYGDAGRWPDIYRANSSSLGRGGEVKPGQVLVLP